MFWERLMARNQVDWYRWLSGASLVLLVADLALNSIFQVFSHNTLLTLLIYIIQDVCLVFSLIILFLALFSTTLSQAGLIGELLQKFQWCILVAITYLGLSIGLHSWSLEQQWQKPELYIWTHGMVSFFIIQRVVGGLHYYLYKRTILQLSDKRFYSQLPDRSYK
nr:transmembrane protein 138-like isoform X1 [Cherax quadricarinatus]